LFESTDLTVVSVTILWLIGYGMDTTTVSLIFRKYEHNYLWISMDRTWPL